MILIQWIFAASLIALGGFVALMNWAIVIRWLFGTRKHSSWVPLFGGIVAAIGVAIVPSSSVRPFWWIPLLIDWGCVPGFAHAIAYGLYHSLQRR
jgi:hypothetical protein